jgi:uncharacterized protein
MTRDLAPAPPPGVPCWVAQLSPDADEAKRFYTALFDWTFENIASRGEPPFHVASRHGDRVAGLTGPQDPAVWIGAVSVHDVDHACRVAEEAGGTAPGDSVDIATVGRFHRLHDPAGAEIHVVQPLEGSDLVRVDRTGGWPMMSLSVDDPSTVARFYEMVFGWQADAAGAVTAFRLPGYLAGAPRPPAARNVVAVASASGPGFEASWTPDFLVADADATAETALARGGQVLPGPPETTRTHMLRLALADPFGAEFTISQPLPAS